jgi:hypothetical protein
MLKDTVEPPHGHAANSEIISTLLFNIDQISGPGRVADFKSNPFKPACQRKPVSKTGPTGPGLIVGFDSEWVNAARAEIDGATGDDNVILAYQFAVLNTATGAETAYIYYTRGGTKKDRRYFEPMLDETLWAARDAGVIDELPDHVTVVGHFLRADLGAVRDWPQLKNKVDSVRGTVCTTMRPIKRTMRLHPRGNRHKVVAICFADTMLLAPQGSSLKKLGETIGAEKIELPPGVIERMDLLLRDDPALFERYALQDAVIAARYYAKVCETLATKLGVSKRMATLGAASISMITDVLESLGLSSAHYFGYELDHKRQRHILTSLTTIWAFAANCYHGGRNEAYRVGLTPEGTPLFDVDLKSAYTTALAMARVPDWDSAILEKNIERLAVVDTAMTFARVRFKFSDQTRFPSLPVRAGDRGLIYPLQGESWCTGAEIVVAPSQGARISVEEGWRVEWLEDSPKPFEAFTRSINATRKAAKVSGDALLDKTAKEIGNSAYGKIAQGVHGMRTVHDNGIDAPKGKRVFDARTGTTRTMPPSQITNPMLAAYVTGLVRAALSEAVATLPDHAIVATATTDGFLSSVPVEHIDVSGPVTTAFAKTRTRIDGDPTIWETKHVIGRALVTKTRGTITAAGIDGEGGDPVLARAGYKFEDRPADPWDECERWIELYSARDYETHSRRSSLTSLREQWRDEADVVEVLTDVRLNLDFDLKREIIDPTDCEGLLCADTRPWRTLEDFTRARDGLEAWKKAQRRVLKTCVDLTDLVTWTAYHEGLKVSGSTAQSGRPPFVNAFMRAMVRDLLDAAWPHKRLADFLTDNGFPTGLDTVKQAKRRGELTLGALTRLSAEETVFAAVVYRACPGMPLERLVAADSDAAVMLRAASKNVGQWSLPYGDGSFFAMSRASVTSLQNQ